jgi:hypothetical protein
MFKLLGLTILTKFLSNIFPLTLYPSILGLLFMITWAVNRILLFHHCITKIQRALSYLYHFVKGIFFVFFLSMSKWIWPGYTKRICVPLARGPSCDTCAWDKCEVPLGSCTSHFLHVITAFPHHSCYSGLNVFSNQVCLKAPSCRTIGSIYNFLRLLLAKYKSKVSCTLYVDRWPDA